jgi:hypothetical protein
MKMMFSMFPDMNPSTDSIGTILEMVRAMVLWCYGMVVQLDKQHLRIRVCVQGSTAVGIFTGVLVRTKAAQPVFPNCFRWTKLTKEWWARVSVSEPWERIVQ